MIIDFHTHVFPDKIAERTIAHLEKIGGITPGFDGTLSGLVGKMAESGVDISVTHPVLTAPKQFDSVIAFADGINRREAVGEGRLISFAGIHPECDCLGEKMKLIRDMGFRGVKIHPDYQDTFINDEKYIEIMRYAREYDLTVITHAGVDGAYRDREVKCTPERVIDLISRVRGVKLVLAHLGGNEMTEDVYETLAGEDVYFDTALVLDYIDEGSFKKILKKHGDDKILFATDAPWADAKKYIEKIRSFNLGQDTEEKILYKNAAGLLNL